MKNFITLFILIITGLSSYSQQRVQYKQVDTTTLSMELYYPSTFDSAKKNPAILFFFGGGWNNGTLSQFVPHARYFAQRGLVCILVEYRVNQVHKTSPFESLKDAKSAIRFIRKNAIRFHIDHAKIAAAGGSAGGHLAAATALIEDYNEPGHNRSVSCVPNALLLFNPVIDNGPGGYGYERIGAAYKSFSPLHNINKGAPPTIMFLGTADALIPVETAKYYQKVMEKVNSRCELFLYEGQPHGFFNYRNFEYYKITVAETDRFLQSIGYLNREPAVEIK